MTEEKLTEEKTICPFCLIELKDQIDWQKFFLIISGYDDIKLNELLLLTDKANEILRKEVERRTGIKSYETQAQQQQVQPLQQQQPFTPPTVPIQGQPSQSVTPNVKYMIDNVILKKWVNKLCPFCKKQNWIVNEQLFQLNEWQQQGMVVIGGGQKVQPVVSIICRDCGYTTISNAMINGLIKPQTKQPG